MAPTTNTEAAVALTNVLADTLNHCGGINQVAIDTITTFPYLAWCMAADLAQVPPPTQATRSCVLTLLRQRMAHQDPFENFGLRVVR